MLAICFSAPRPMGASPVAALPRLARESRSALLVLSGHAPQLRRNLRRARGASLFKANLGKFNKFLLLNVASVHVGFPSPTIGVPTGPSEGSVTNTYQRERSDESFER